jgi:hypothetical protein
MRLVYFYNLKIQNKKRFPMSEYLFFVGNFTVLVYAKKAFCDNMVGIIKMGEKLFFPYHIYITEVNI